MRPAAADRVVFRAWAGTGGSGSRHEHWPNGLETVGWSFEVSRISRLTEDFERLKDRSVIVEYAHLQPNWLIVLNLKIDLYLTNKEARAFIDGAQAEHVYGR